MIPREVAAKAINSIAAPIISIIVTGPIYYVILNFSFFASIIAAVTLPLCIRILYQITNK